jgi:hypothetical protein
LGTASENILVRQPCKVPKFPEFWYADHEREFARIAAGEELRDIVVDMLHRVSSDLTTLQDKLLTPPFDWQNSRSLVHWELIDLLLMQEILQLLFGFETE